MNRRDVFHLIPNYTPTMAIGSPLYSSSSVYLDGQDETRNCNLKTFSIVWLFWLHHLHSGLPGPCGLCLLT